MKDAIRPLFDPHILYAEHNDRLKKWIQALRHYADEVEHKRSPGLQGLDQIETGMRSICQDHGFKLVRNEVTSDEDKIYTIDVPLAQGFMQLVEMTTDDIELIDCLVRLDEMLEELDYCDAERAFPYPDAWERRAAHYLASQRELKAGIDYRAFEPTAVAALNSRNPGWRNDEKLRKDIELAWHRIPNGPIETSISTSSGVASLNINDREIGWTWSQGELFLPEAMVSESLAAGAIGRPLASLVEIPAFSQSNLTIQRVSKRHEGYAFITNAMHLEKLEIMEHFQ
tara:strand:- start:9156 stop:10010 length:855 start_codon:yes stop_codon:yes gene_type:complete